MQIHEDTISSFLVASGLLRGEDVFEARREAFDRGIPIYEVLVASGRISDGDFRHAVSYTHGIPYISLIGEKIPFETLASIPEPMSRIHDIVAFKKEGSTLHVALLDIGALAHVSFLEKEEHLKISPHLTDIASMHYVLALYKKQLQSDFDTKIHFHANTVQKLSPSIFLSTSGREKTETQATPIVKMVETLISHALLDNASDIHIIEAEDATMVRYRTHGSLYDVMALPKEVMPLISAYLKRCAHLDIREHTAPQEGNFSRTRDSETVSFRLSILPTYLGEKIFIRVMHEGSHGLALTGLGVNQDEIEAVHQALGKGSGMILVSSPKDEGKTTFWYALLDMLNMRSQMIATVENPIEYKIPRILQTEARPEKGMRYPDAVRAVLRQDPDVLGLGDIADSETALLALHAAVSGKLVLATLTARDTGETINRLLSMDMAKAQLGRTLSMIVARRLVRKLTEDKERYFLGKAEQKALARIVSLDRLLAMLKREALVEPNATWDTVPFYRPKEHARGGENFGGKIGIHEVMHVTPIIRDRLLEGASGDEIREEAIENGMRTLIEDGICAAVQGITTFEEVLQAVSR